MYILVTLCLHLLVINGAEAQPLPIGDAFDDYSRLLQVAGVSDRQISFAVRPVAAKCADGSTRHPWSERIECPDQQSGEGLRLDAVSPKSDLYVNTVRPFGLNDGVLWQGAGATFSFAGGVYARFRFLSVMVRPQFVYTQNADFELSRLPLASNQSIYAYAYRNDIDWPQRFGDEQWSELVFDGSYAKVEYRMLSAGMSSQNMWWGPGIRNSIVMSNNAPGFRHFFIASNDRIRTPIGAIEGQWIWGSLSHSEHFVDASYGPERISRGSEENDRFITAITMNWNPTWIPGLYVGAAHSVQLHYSVQKTFRRDYLGVINLPFFNSDDPRPRGTDDKLVSLYGRWLHPKSGVEVYGEWARGDHTSNFRDLFIEPDHARGWTLGLQKVFKPSGRAWTRLLAEVTNLERPRESGGRAARGSYFYTHQSIRQGYTHKGQVLGAGIGPGSNSQWFQFDVFAPFGKVGIHLLRWVHDNDRYFVYHLADLQRGWDYEVEIGGGASFLAFWHGLEIGGSVTYTQLMNRDHLFGNDVPNVNVHLSVRKQLMGIR